MLEGLHVCGPCSTTSRQRLQRVLVLAGGLAILSVGAGVVLAISEGGVWWAAPLAAALEGVLLYGGTLAVMKRLNRKRAAELAASGEIWPDWEAMTTPEPPRAMTSPNSSKDFVCEDTYTGMPLTNASGIGQCVKPEHKCSANK